MRDGEISAIVRALHRDAPLTEPAHNAWVGALMQTPLSEEDVERAADQCLQAHRIPSLDDFIARATELSKDPKVLDAARVEKERRSDAVASAREARAETERPWTPRDDWRAAAEAKRPPKNELLLGLRDCVLVATAGRSTYEQRLGRSVQSVESGSMRHASTAFSVGGVTLTAGPQAAALVAELERRAAK